MRTYLFDDFDSLIHAVLGAIVAYLVVTHHGIIGAGIFDVFLIYELSEFEDPVATIGDVFEFVIGFLNAAMILFGGGL